MDSKTYKSFLATHSEKLNRELIPAATVVLLRNNTDLGNSRLEVLIMHRNPKLKFMGGSWVFPGGKLDEADFDSSKDLMNAVLNAAVREVKEETNLDIETGMLAIHSHWVPPPVFPKLFATWFFVAPAPVSEVVVDGSEIIDYQWLTPQAALDKRDSGEFEFAPPTFITLSLLKEFTTVKEALDGVKDNLKDLPFFETKIVKTDEGPIALWSSDAGYGTGNLEAVGKRFRLNMGAEKWALEKS